LCYKTAWYIDQFECRLCYLFSRTLVTEWSKTFSATISVCIRNITIRIRQQWFPNTLHCKKKYCLLICRKWREWLSIQKVALRELSDPRQRVRCNFSVNRFSSRKSKHGNSFSEQSGFTTVLNPVSHQFSLIAKANEIGKRQKNKIRNTVFRTLSLNHVELSFLELSSRR